MKKDLKFKAMIFAAFCLGYIPFVLPAAAQPCFDGPVEFLRSVNSNFTQFGPAGFPGLDVSAVRYFPATGAELAKVLEELAALSESERTGTTIGLRPGVTYDLSGLRSIADIDFYGSLFVVPSGVTVAALAGEGAAPALRFDYPLGFEKQLAEKAYSARALIGLESNSRLAGLRIVGPDVPVHDADYDALPASNLHGIRASSNAVVEFCEISRFHWSGVSVYGPDVIVRGNDIFDVHAYPVGVNGSAHVEGNRICWTWHAVAGSGIQGLSYIFRYNLMIHAGPGGARHAVDMHAWRQMMQAGGAAWPFISIGGDTMQIAGNVFVNDAAGMARWRTQPGVRRQARRLFLEQNEQSEGHAYPMEVGIRGVPRDLAVVTGNWFANTDEDRTVRMYSEVFEPGCHSRANLWVYDNFYGPQAEPKDIGSATRARIYFMNPPLHVAKDSQSGRWRTDRIAVLKRGIIWRPAVEISLPKGLKTRRVIFRLDQQERIYQSPPAPGAVTFETNMLKPGVYIFTIDVEDERGTRSRHDLALTIEDDKTKQPEN